MRPKSLDRPRAGRPSVVCLHLTTLEDRVNPVIFSEVGPSPTPPLNVDPSMSIEMEGNQLVVYAMDGLRARFRVTPFPDYEGPIGTALGDLTGDGRLDVAVAAGQSGGPVVRTFDGTTGRPLATFFAYDPSFRGGVDIDVGDIDGDGVAEIVTGTGPGGGPHVRAFRASDAAPVRSFFAYEPSFRGGVDVAVLDTDGDGVAEIVTGPGASGGPRVVVYDPQTQAQVASFYAFNPGITSGLVLRSIGQADGSVLLEATPVVPDGADPVDFPLARLIDLSNPQTPNVDADFSQAALE